MNTGEPKFLVMLATYNGAVFLDEQLDTIASQTVGNIDILASDDGSSDATPAILATRAKLWNRGSFSVVAGPKQGFAENFRSLLLRAGDDADFYAFSDQDDLWDADKFERAVADLGQFGDRPSLFCSRTRTVSRNGVVIGASHLFRHKPCFSNALVQSLAGANTMVMNRAAFDLVREGSRRSGFITHDWWAYQLVTGAGGEVIYAGEPCISYRQHEGNLVGENVSFSARLRRASQLIGGRLRHYTDRNFAAIGTCLDLLTPGNRRDFELLRDSRKRGAFGRVLGLRRSGAFRQTMADQAGLYVAALFGRL